MLIPLTSDRAAVVINAGDRPSLIVNRDITNAVIVGNDRGLSNAEQSNISIIDPLGSMAVDGKKTLYAIPQTRNTTPLVDIMPGATYWAPSPAQVAAQINALGLMKDTTGQSVKTSVDAQTGGGTIANEIATAGVPLLSKVTNILNDQNHNLPANSSTTIVSNLPVTQIGYEIYLKALCPGASTAPFITLDLNWIDTATGLTVWHDEWNIGVGSTSGGSVYFGMGPTKADVLTITAFNADLLQAFTLTTVMHQTSRVFLRDDWRQETFNTIPGFAAGTLHTQQANCLTAFNGNINAGATITRYVALYAGKVTVSALAFGQVGNIFIDTLDPNINPGGVQQGPGSIYGAALPATGITVEGNVSFPRSPTILRITNTSGVASNYSMGVYIDEYQS